MPPRRRRATKRRPKRRSRPTTASLYRTAIPRTIQRATRRPKSLTLKFVVNQTYLFDGSQVPNGETAFLCYRANSIYQSQIPTSANGTAPTAAWTSQDPSIYSNMTSDNKFANAEGFDDWKNRFNHFVVKGSKISSTFEPTNVGVPAVHFHLLSGSLDSVTGTTKSSDLNKRPYCFRSSLNPTTVQRQSAGTRMYQTYSVRKFEGVKDVQDNSNLRGDFGPDSTTNLPKTPAEESYFYVGIAPVNPASTTKLCSGIVRVKVEYIVFLKEPTLSNQVTPGYGPSASLPFGGFAHHDEL